MSLTAMVFVALVILAGSAFIALAVWMDSEHGDDE